MGQNNTSQIMANTNYAIVKQLPNGSIVREEVNNKLHFLKEFSFTNQEAYQHAFVNFSKKLPEKHEHILYLERTNTKVQNTFCSTFYKIGLIYEYLDHTLQKEIQQRIHDRKVFDEKEVWSVLCSCALAVTEMIRLQGRSHSALKTKDIRLTKEGVVKILSLEMVGMDGDHDSNEEGTTKMLASTIINCLLMDEITNDSPEFLQDLVESLDCTSEMKNILHMMLNSQTRFMELQEYLFKLVQEETDSLASYSNTPMLNEKVKNQQIYSLIAEDSKEEDMLTSLTRDEEDLVQYPMRELQTHQFENPDENDIMDDSKSRLSDSNMNTLREKPNNYNESGSIQQQKGSSLTSKIDSVFNSYSKQNNNIIDIKKDNLVKFNHKILSINDNGLFTDPKLLNLINTDLQEIKKRKSVVNSGKIIQNDNSMMELIDQQPKIKINHSFIKKNSSATQTSAHNLTPQFMSLQQIKEDQGVRSVSQQNIKLPDVVENNKVRSQKEIVGYRTNPQQEKKDQKKYGNIMQDEQMGFKKEKIVKPKQKQQEKLANNHNFNISDRSQFSNQFYDTNQKLNIVHYSQVNSANSRFQERNFKQYPHRKEGNLRYNHSQELKIKQSGVSQRQDEFRIEKKRPKVSEKMVKEERSQNQLEYANETYGKGRYEGTKLNNMRHGKGVFYYNQGGWYTGYWKENKMHGKGVLYYPNNKIAYEGDWRNDQLYGVGILYNEEVGELRDAFDYRDWSQVDDFWVRYEGQFVEDNKQGEGKLYLVNGQIFQGKFKGDMVSGEGVLFRKDGGRVRGLWADGKLVRLF